MMIAATLAMSSRNASRPSPEIQGEPSKGDMSINFLDTARRPVAEWRHAEEKFQALRLTCWPALRFSIRMNRMDQTV
jgi:hypothetical protein